MKKNRMGFTLLETLIVSTFIASTLIYLFIQITNIKTSYDITFRYDTVPGLYGAQSMVQYLNSNTYEEVKTNLKSSDLHYIDLTDGTALSNGSNLYYKDLINKLDIKMMIFIKEDTSEILTNLDNITVFSEEMKKFIRKIDSSKIENLYRLVIEYNDNTFASVKIGTGTEPTYTAYTIGDQVLVAGQTWNVIKTSTSSDATVTLLKSTNTDNNEYIFDSSTDIYSNSYIKGLVDTYVASLNLGNNLIEGRLIEGEEVCLIAGLDWDKVKLTNTTFITSPDWIYSTNYWTQTKYSISTGHVWRIYSNGSINGNSVAYNGYGIRPVITINKTAIG